MVEFIFSKDNGNLRFLGEDTHTNDGSEWRKVPISEIEQTQREPMTSNDCAPQYPWRVSEAMDVFPGSSCALSALITNVVQRVEVLSLSPPFCSPMPGARVILSWPTEKQ